MTFTLAWRNLWRHGRRTVFSLVAIAAACVVVVFLPSLQAGSYAGMIRTYTGLVDGYAEIQHPKYLDTPAIRDSFVLDDDLRAVLDHLPAGINHAERGIAYALLSSNNRSIGAQIMGVEPHAEPSVSTIPSNVLDGHYLSAESDVVLGETLARNLHVDIGDNVTLLGVGRDGSLAADVLTVAGVFRSGITELDRSLAQMSLARFDAAFAMNGGRHTIVINGSDSQALRQAIERLRPAVEARGLALRDWTELQPSLYSAIELDITGAVLMYAVLIAVVVVSLLNTLLMSVLERTREFGIMLALGTAPVRIGVLVVLESALLAALGLAIGLAVGVGLALYFYLYGFTFPGMQELYGQYGLPGVIYPQLSFVSIVLGPLVIFGFILLASLYPTLRIRRLNAVEAMHAV